MPNDHRIIIGSPLTVSFVSAFLVSLIKLTLWLKFFPQAKGRLRTWGQGLQGAALFQQEWLRSEPRLAWIVPAWD